MIAAIMEEIDAIHIESLPLYRDGTQTLAALVAFFLIDQLQVALGWFPRKETTGRYFSLHVLCNAFVTVVHLDDVYYTWMDPANSASVPCDMSGTNVMLALHLYHILAFPLTPIDWVHHISMVLVMTPLAYLFQPGHLMGHGAFFATGLPGGLDYLMLVFVKKGWMRSITEKRLNAYIQNWVRAPGCIIDAFLIWTTLRTMLMREAAGIVPILPSRPEVLRLPSAWLLYPIYFILVSSMFWNGPFFNRRVIESHQALSDRIKAKRGKPIPVDKND